MTVSVGKLVSVIEAFADPSLAEDWDNVGLVIGSSTDQLTGPVMLTIDLTSSVLDEALAHKCSAILVYHPPIFRPIKRLVDDGRIGGVLLRAARAGLAIYAIHTALDAAHDGMADWLADRVLHAPKAGTERSADRRALRPAAKVPTTQELKIVTFVPRDAVERVRAGLASAGAGRIGHYSVCSFVSDGFGTFLGDDTTKPTVGQPGHLNVVPECRLEMVCPKQSLPIALQTLRQFHPYEEPAIDVIQLAGRPRRDIGLGRRLVLDKPEPIDAIAQRLKHNLALDVISIAKVHQGPITTIGVCPGSGGELAELALSEGCELFVTGEMRHHDVLAMTAAGLSIALCGHTNTERGYLPQLAGVLGKRLPEAKFVVSARDADPQKSV